MSYTVKLPTDNLQNYYFLLLFVFLLLWKLKCWGRPMESKLKRRGRPMESTENYLYSKLIYVVTIPPWIQDMVLMLQYTICTYVSANTDETLIWFWPSGAWIFPLCVDVVVVVLSWKAALSGWNIRRFPAKGAKWCLHPGNYCTLAWQATRWRSCGMF